jgi:hypothetical protein
MTTPVPETVSYPGWWSSASAVTIIFADEGKITSPVTQVEIFTYGISVSDGSYWSAAIFPWHAVKYVQKAA